MKPFKFEPIRLEDVYVSILTARRVGTVMQPVPPPELQTYSPIMTAVVQLLAEDCCMKLGVMAHLIGMEPFVLTNVCRFFTGQSLQEFQFSYRMKRTCEWLTCTDLPLAEIARRCGFGSQQVLGHTFQKQMKMPPGKYRRLHRPAHFRELYQWKE